MAEEVSSIVHKLCYGDASKVSANPVSSVIKKAAAMGLDEKEILKEAISIGLPANVGQQIVVEMQQHHSEIR